MGSKSEYSTPHIKDIIVLLGKGILLTSLFLFPGAALGISAIYDFYENRDRLKDYKIWRQYSLSKLRYLLHRLYTQKMVEVIKEGNNSIIRLNEKGKLRVLKYNLDEIELIKPPKWDGKWRLIIYDISMFKKKKQESFRRILQKLKLLQLQKSVYLTPYPCDDEIKFLREYFNISKEVLCILAESIENQDVYKQYFNLS